MARLKVDVSEIERLAADIEDAFDTLGPVIADSVNRISAAVYRDSVDKIVSQINLAEGYVEDKVELVLEATAEKPVAILEVSDEPVFLNRFLGARQKTQSNVWTEAKFAAKLGESAKTNLNAKNPNAKPFIRGWIERTGDPLRGIAKGQKGAGMAMTISNAKGETHFNRLFLRPILSGKSFAGNIGTFMREKATGELKARYGPSPYQVVKGVWRDGEEEILDALSEAVLTDAENAIKGMLNK